MSLALDARQRAMLAEMGVRLWQRPAERAAPVAPESGAAAADQARAGAPSGPEPAARAAHPPAPGPRPARPAPAVPALAPAAPADSPLGPRPEGIEHMGWPQLEAAVAACRACGLCAGRTQTVFGVGSRRADWMVVGEAPGENEDRQGQPFVGQAGKLLDAMLGAIGLSRQADDAIDSGAAGVDQVDAGGQNDAKHGVYIANVLKCRPPGNRNPQPDEIAQCEPYLRRQVALVQPRVILAMGRFAVQSLLKTSEPIGRLRGRVHHYAGVPVIVTYHPAYLLRALPDKAKAWQDLCLALEVMGGQDGR
ncbi:MAG TPA: uracil-DNA glycosylase [Ottowia sp.]|nr:uracil-DNA glycosylase [Ottowia sp.]